MTKIGARDLTSLHTRQLLSELEYAQQRWIEATLTSDEMQFEPLLAEEFFCVSIAGTLQRRAEFLEHARRKANICRSIEIEQPNVVIGEETAIMSYIARVDGVVDGIPFRGPVRITKVWGRISNQWRVVCFHAGDSRLVESWDRLKGNSHHR